jgi:hypothetical protein
MKIAALALLLPTSVGAFAPSINKASSSLSLLFSTSAPERVAPGAGYEPAWENRPGLSPEQYMASDMTKPDLSGMWECPLTRWDSNGYV